MIDSYLNLLQESLENKLKVLAQIEQSSQKQSELLKQDELDLKAFDLLVEEKDSYIEQLTKLDEGFETLYERVREELLQNKASHPDQIRQLQSMIKRITEMHTSIQAQESRNKADLEAYFAKERAQLGRTRRSSKVAYDYYKSMSKSAGGQSSILDQKN